MRDSNRLFHAMAVIGANALIGEDKYGRSKAFVISWEIIKAMRNHPYEGWSADQALIVSGVCPSCLSSSYLMPSERFGKADLICYNCNSEWLDFWS